MRNTRTVVQSLALIALTICGSAIVHGQDFIKAPGHSYYLDQDTKEGKFSEWRLDDLSTLTALRARVRIPVLRQDPQWIPDFHMMLRQGDQSTEGDVAVELSAQDSSSPLVIQVVQGGADGRFVEQYRIGKTLAVNEKIDIDLDWSTPGAVTVKIGENTYTLKIPSQIERVQVTSSTGEMIIDPLVMGSFKH